MICAKALEKKAARKVKNERNKFIIQDGICPDCGDDIIYKRERDKKAGWLANRWIYTYICKNCGELLSFSNYSEICRLQG